MEHFPVEKAKVGGKTAKRAQVVSLHCAREADATSEGNTNSMSFEEWKFSFPWEVWYLGSEQRARKKKLKLLDLATDIQMKVEQTLTFSAFMILHKQLDKLQEQKCPSPNLEQCQK